MDKVIKEMILSWKGLFLFGGVILLVAGIQALIAGAIYVNTTRIADAACMMKSFEVYSSQIKMNVDCGGTADSTNDNNFIVAYLKDPKPFTCTLYEGPGRANCKLPE